MWVNTSAGTARAFYDHRSASETSSSTSTHIITRRRFTRDKPRRCNEWPTAASRGWLVTSKCAADAAAVAAAVVTTPSSYTDRLPICSKRREELLWKSTKLTRPPVEGIALTRSPSLPPLSVFGLDATYYLDTAWLLRPFPFYRPLQQIMYQLGGDLLHRKLRPALLVKLIVSFTLCVSGRC